ncbi:hypothetical protein BGZ75_002331 [Mortierella antarctica]|nr:hypothetical protein BGZ75_002331 [Mortierella antarctica]
MAPRRRATANAPAASAAATAPAAAAPVAATISVADLSAAIRDSPSEPSSPEASEDEGEEVDALNKLLATYRLEDEEEDDVEIGGVGNPTKEDLQKLLGRRKNRLRAKARTLGMIHARFNDAVLQMKQIRLE